MEENNKISNADILEEQGLGPESFGEEETQAFSFDENNRKILEDMVQAGVQYGRSKGLTNPGMNKYLLKISREVEVFNLLKTFAVLEEAIIYLKKLIDEKKSILFVGVKPATKEPIEGLAKSLNMPFVNERWLGGTLTNFKTISQRVDYLKDLKKKQESPDWEKYTKKERQDFQKEIKELEEMLGGIVSMDKLPDAVFLVDINFHKTAVKEAKKLKIPIVAIAGSDNNPQGIDYLVPANDKAPSSIKYLLSYIKEKLTIPVTAV